MSAPESLVDVSEWEELGRNQGLLTLVSILPLLCISVVSHTLATAVKSAAKEGWRCRFCLFVFV